MNIFNASYYVWQLLTLVIALYYLLIWSKPQLSLSVSPFTFFVSRWGLAISWGLVSLGCSLWPLEPTTHLSTKVFLLAGLCAAIYESTKTEVKARESMQS
jgi:hypothetical protein